MSETFGYQYRDLSFISTVGDRETLAFEGRLGLQSLPSGISTCASDLSSLHDCAHTGMAERSVNIVLLLEGDPYAFSIGVHDRVSIAPTGAWIIGLADSTAIASRYGAGQRCRSLLLQTRPEDLADDDIAGQVAPLLAATSISPMPISRRITPLIEELAAPSSGGAVGRMLAESCALGIFAHALLSLGAASSSSSPRLSRRDHAKVTRIRDRMLTNPEADFTLAALAREAGMSTTVLKQKFSAAFGQSVFSFLREARLQHAKAGIENEGWTVSQAAHFAGYRHHSNFTTAFRRRYGVQPRHCRKGGRL